MRWKKASWRHFFVDSAAFLLYNLIIGIVAWGYEENLAYVNHHDWLWARGIYSIAKFPLAAVCGWLTDKLQMQFTKRKQSKWRSYVAACSAITVYQLPFYIGAWLHVGLTWHQWLIVLPIFLADGFVFGWLYGWILFKLRKKYLLQQEEQKAV